MIGKNCSMKNGTSIRGTEHIYEIISSISSSFQVGHIIYRCPEFKGTVSLYLSLLFRDEKKKTYLDRQKYFQKG